METSPQRVMPTKRLSKYYFMFLLLPTNSCPVTFFTTVFSFSIEASSFNIVVLPSISCFVTIFATFFAYNLEVISCVFLSLSKIKCYNLQYRLSFSCFSLLPNSVLHNQRIYLLRSLYAIFKILTLEENLTGLYSSNNTSKNVPSYHLHLYHIFH